MKPARLFIALVGLAAGCGIAGPCPADIFSFTDEGGTVYLSNVPTDTRFVALVRTPRHSASKPIGARSSGVNRERYAPLIEEAAHSYALDSALLHAVIDVESGYDPSAVSSRGAAGLMQLMPVTARRYGVADVHDPIQNVHGGARYLRDLMRTFDNDLSLTLAAYNAGENAVIRRGYRIPPFHETQRYVPKVLDIYRRLSTTTSSRK